VISRQDAEKLALPLLEAKAKSEDPKPEEDGFKHGIREIIFADINNDGSPDFGASIFDSLSWSEKLLFVESTNGLWNDPSKLRIVDFSKDFPGYDIGRISGANDDYVDWYFGTIMRLRFDGKGKAHIFRAGAKKFGADNWICCAIEIDKIAGDKVQAEFSSNVEKSKSIKSVKVDAVVTSPHGDVVWYTGP
jgi:hypothetical protein